MLNPLDLLAPAIAVVEAEGGRLHEEFHRPQGPRGRRASADIDREIELRLRDALQALCPCRFAGEETGASPAPDEDGSAASSRFAEWLWLIDPHDGTFEFLQGRRGSSISVALLRGTVPVLAVVHSPLAPDLGRDTIAWAEGAPGIRRNGRWLDVDLSQRALAPDELIFASASSALRPNAWSRAAAPARYVAMPSIAYRLARVAAGDGIATLTIHSVNEYDIAAGFALVRAARGPLLDAAGEAIVLQGAAEARANGCFAGAPQAVRRLLAFDRKALEREPRRQGRVAIGFPRRLDDLRLSRAQGALLAIALGERLRAPPAPSPAKEIAFALARSIATSGGYDPASAIQAYRPWMRWPFELAAPASGALLRMVPIAILACADPRRAALHARQDLGRMELQPVAREAGAAYAAAVASGVGGGRPADMLQAAFAQLDHRLTRSVIERAVARERPASTELARGATRASLQYAFHQLLHAEGYEAMVEEVASAGGETDLNAALAGALLAASRGREALPPYALLNAMAHRPGGGGASDDVLELGEVLAGLA